MLSRNVAVLDFVLFNDAAISIVVQRVEKWGGMN